MLDTKPLQNSIALVVPGITEHGGLNRILAAAVVSLQFRRLLLENPSLAIQTGFQGEAFSLTTEESALLLGTRADSLTDLAQQLTCAFGEHPLPSSQIAAQPLEFFGQ